LPSQTLTMAIRLDASEDDEVGCDKLGGAGEDGAGEVLAGDADGA